MLAEARLLSGTDTRAPEECRGVAARARVGDPEAFHAIFTRYGKPVLSFICHLIGDRSRAEELTQETFVRAYARLRTLREDARLSTWLFGIARNVVREAIKEKYKNQRKVGLEGQISLRLEDDKMLPDEHLRTGELRVAIRNALAGLSEDYRIVFVLKVFKQMSYEEVALVTGASVGKLKTDLHRARLEMRRRLRPYLGEPVSPL